MLTLLLVGLAGCSSAATPGAAAGSGAADPSGSAASPPSTPGAGSAGGSGTGGGTDAACPKGVQRGEVTVTEVDNHTSVCLSKGTRLDVYLHARMDQQWSKPTPELAVLQPTANGRGALVYQTRHARPRKRRAKGRNRGRPATPSSCLKLR